MVGRRQAARQVGKAYTWLVAARQVEYMYTRLVVVVECIKYEKTCTYFGRRLD